MGLGGIARDSIADLASLVNDDPATNDSSINATDHLRSASADFASSFDAPLADDANEELKWEEVEERVFADEQVEEEGTIEQPPPPVASGMYYGFQYEGYEDYYAEDFSPYYNQDNGTGEKKNVFCCLFPWMGGKKEPLQQQQQQQQQQTEETAETTLSTEQLGQNLRAQTASPSHAEGIASSLVNNGASEQLPRPAASPVTSSSPDKLKEPPTINPPQDSPRQPTAQQDTQQPPPSSTSAGPKKGILKVKHCINHYNNINNSTTTNPNKNPSKTIQAASPDGKRHLFPAYEAKSSPQKGDNNTKKKKISWINMARVLTIPSRKDIPLSQKAQVWWQRSDYDDFKKTGRIISKAMECGGSEIWLTSTNAWGKGQQSRDRASSKKQVDNEELVGAESDTDSEYVKALEKYTKRSTRGHTITTAEDSSSAPDNESDFGNKWWCKFGHSRRGLEHIVSSSEGKARQQSVLLAIEMVLEEQKRQRIARTKDPNKLRNVAMQYTSWARDLALAAGAADNEAVETNFDVSAKSRSHHFAEKSMHLLNNGVVAGGGVAMAIRSQILDENTHGRRNSTMMGSSSSKSLQDSHHVHELFDNSLSKKAQGFIPGGENSAVPASQIMSGMGLSLKA